MKTFSPPNIKNLKVLAYDTETTGLDWKKDRLVGHVLTLGPQPEDTFYFPVRHGGGGNYDPEAVANWLRSEVASRTDLLLVGHHLKFDLHFAANDGVLFNNPLECTMVNAALIDENQFSYSLENVAKRCDVQPKKTDIYEYLASVFGGQPDKSQMENFWKLAGDDPKGVGYAAGDGTTTYQVWQKQQAILDFEELRSIWDVECRCIRTLFRMERRGVRVDEERLSRFGQILNAKKEDAIAKYPFLRNLNVLSPIQMKKVMEDLGKTDWPKTAKGAPSFPESWLSTHEEGKAIVQVRKLNNMVSSFVDGQVKNHIHEGRVHTNFNQLKGDEYGVITGRLSSSAPNLQQVPKRNKELAPLFRGCFMPSTEGYVWCTNDFKQQEYVVFAHYAQAKAMLEGYRANPPIDCHQVVADMCHVERDPTAKRINLGLVYGMGIAQLADQLGVPVEEAKRIMGLYHARIPEAKKFLKLAEKRAKDRGFVHTMLGRRRRLPFDFAYKAGNGVIQCCSADITKLKMVEIDEMFARNGDVGHLMLQVHDALDWEVPPDRLDLDEEAKKIMTAFGPNDVITLDAPLGIDSCVAEDWGRASFPKYDKWEEAYGNK